MFSEEEKDTKSTEVEQEEKEVEQPSQEQLLKEEIAKLELKIALLEKESEKKLLEFVEKKSKEASEIILKKEKEISEKYKKEFEDLKKYLNEKPLASLAEVISQFESVILSITDPQVSNYLLGFKMFLTKFSDLLEDFGITTISPELNQEFDSNIMEATSIKEVDDESLDNKILSIFSKGYKLHERMIKLASVEVAKFSK